MRCVCRFPNVSVFRSILGASDVLCVPFQICPSFHSTLSERDVLCVCFLTCPCFRAPSVRDICCVGCCSILSETDALCMFLRMYLFIYLSIYEVRTCVS